MFLLHSDPSTALLCWIFESMWSRFLPVVFSNICNLATPPFCLIASMCPLLHIPDLMCHLTTSNKPKHLWLYHRAGVWAHTNITLLFWLNCLIVKKNRKTQLKKYLKIFALECIKQPKLVDSIDLHMCGCLQVEYSSYIVKTNVTLSSKPRKGCFFLSKAEILFRVLNMFFPWPFPLELFVSMQRSNLGFTFH